MMTDEAIKEMKELDEFMKEMIRNEKVEAFEKKCINEIDIIELKEVLKKEFIIFLNNNNNDELTLTNYISDLLFNTDDFGSIESNDFTSNELKEYFEDYFNFNEFDKLIEGGLK